MYNLFIYLDLFIYLFIYLFLKTSKNVLTTLASSQCWHLQLSDFSNIVTGHS